MVLGSIAAGNKPHTFEKKVLAIAVLQDQARQWLEKEAPKYRLVKSQFVIDEASRGDSDAAKRRLAALGDVGLLLPDPEVDTIADRIVSGCMIPPKATNKALHRSRQSAVP